MRDELGLGVADEELDVLHEDGLHQRELAAHGLEQAVGGPQQCPQLELLGTLLLEVERQPQQLQRRLVRLEVHEQHLHVRVGPGGAALLEDPHHAAAARLQGGRHLRALLELYGRVKRDHEAVRGGAAHRVQSVGELQPLTLPQGVRRLLAWLRRLEGDDREADGACSLTDALEVDARRVVAAAARTTLAPA